MKRKINVSKVLKGFDGEVMQVNTEKYDDKNLPILKDRTLQSTLITYMRMAHRIKMSDENRNVAYILGTLIGQATGQVTLTTEQYDVLKEIVDNGRARDQKNQEEDVFPIEISKQVKKMVDEAEIVEETIVEEKQAE